MTDTPSSRDTGAATWDGIVVRSKVWVERDGIVLMSEYRARLLEAVAEQGSVAAAAEALGLPYRTAWKKLREMEGAAGAPLLQSGSGGAGGGQSILTEQAAEMLQAFRRLSDPVTEDVRDRFPSEAEHFGLATRNDEARSQPRAGSATIL
jgi:molybdate transport system regulatory protein